MKPVYFIQLLALILTGSAFLWGLIYLLTSSNVFGWIACNWEIWSIAAIIGLFLFTYIARRHGWDLGE